MISTLPCLGKVRIETCIYDEFQLSLPSLFMKMTEQTFVTQNDIKMTDPENVQFVNYHFHT